MSEKLKFTDNSWKTVGELVNALIKAGALTPKNEHTEIERKWKMNDGPGLVHQFHSDNRMHGITGMTSFIIKHIPTAYVSIYPEVRIRANYTEYNELINYQLAYKGPADESGLERVEYEFDIDEHLYHRLLTMSCTSVYPFNGSIVIPRTIYLARYANDPFVYELKVSDFGNDWQLEIEFPTREIAKSFKIPERFASYVGEDVTDKDSAKMKNYWKRTRIPYSGPRTLYTAI